MVTEPFSTQEFPSPNAIKWYIAPKRKKAREEKRRRGDFALGLMSVFTSFLMLLFYCPLPTLKPSMLWMKSLLCELIVLYTVMFYLGDAASAYAHAECSLLDVFAV
jgi:hypothetical protein